MPKRLFYFIAFCAAFGTTIGALDLSGFTNLLPPGAAKWLAILPPIGAAFVHLAQLWGDLADDGQKNDSFKIRCCWLCFLVAGLLALLSVLPSCTPKDAGRIPWRLTVTDSEHGVSASYSSKAGIDMIYQPQAQKQISIK